MTNKLTPAQIADLCVDYSAGVDRVELAQAYGVSAPTVYRLLRKNGATMRRTGPVAGRTFTLSLDAAQALADVAMSRNTPGLEELELLIFAELARQLRKSSNR